MSYTIMNTLNQILRLALFFVLTIVGMLLAVVFMISTAIAMAILYIVARISGRPFAFKSYWDQRRRSRTRPTFHHKDPSGKAPNHATTSRHNAQNVTDVEMREIP